jgi:hypothetical protein
MSAQDPGYLDTKFMVDPYRNWAKDEGVPIVEADTLDLFTLDTKPWARFGMKGAICHLTGRCDYLTAFLFELLPGATSAPTRHVYEEAFYVLQGSGETEIILSDGSMHRIEWGPKSLFAVPVNASARHRSHGPKTALFVALNDMRYLMGLYRNEAFLFANASPMHARQAQAMTVGLLASPAALDAQEAEINPLPLADMSVGADVTCLAPKTSTKARRQMQGRHILGVDGAGFTLSFASQTSEIVRTDWRHGIITGLAGMRYHQHFNAKQEPARFIAIELGSISSPMFRARRSVYGDDSVYASGASLIERNEERDEIRAALPL